MGKKRNRVYLTDKMVLIGFGIGAAYWIIECLLYVFLADQANLTDRFFGPDFNALSTRIVVICLFIMFGSHAQYTINKRKQVEEELLEVKKMVEKLQQDLEAQKGSQKTAQEQVETT